MTRKRGSSPKEGQFNPAVYSSWVKNAANYVKTYNKKTQEAAEIRKRVAEIALSVKRYGRLTVFAKDIGLGYTTLLSWIEDLEKPIYQIRKDEGEEVDLGALGRAKGKIKKGDSKRKAMQIYNKEKAKCSEDLAIDKMIKQFKSARFHVCHEYILSGLNQESLVILSKLSEEIYMRLNDHLEFYRPVKRKSKNRARAGSIQTSLAH